MTNGAFHLSDLTGQTIPVVMKISILIKIFQSDQSNPKQYAFFFSKTSWKKPISYSKWLVWPSSGFKSKQFWGNWQVSETHDFYKGERLVTSHKVHVLQTLNFKENEKKASEKRFLGSLMRNFWAIARFHCVLRFHRSVIVNACSPKLPETVV